MTLSTTTSRVSYPGAGSVGPYAFTFRILAAADLRVVRRDAIGTETVLILTTDYSIAGVGDLAGSVTLTVALAVGETIVILRAPSLVQPTSIQNQGSYFPKTHEDEFDRLVMQLQRLKDQLDRSVGVTESYDPAIVSVQVQPETGKYLGWRSATQLDNFDAPVSSGVVLPAEGRTVASLTAYLLNNAIYNVKDFGAKGDDVTDDTAAIQAAIDAAAGPLVGTTYTWLGVVVFPAGIYRHTTLTYKGAPWHGVASGATVLRYTGAGGVAVNAVAVDDNHRLVLEITDLTLDGSLASAAASGLAIGRNYRSLNALNNVRLTSFPGWGLVFRTDNWILSFYGVMIDHCTLGGMTDSDGFAVFVYNSIFSLAWYSLTLENNGTAGSGRGGGVHMAVAGVGQAWSFFGGVWESNKGIAEGYFVGGDYGFHGLYTESEIGFVTNALRMRSGRYTVIGGRFIGFAGALAMRFENIAVGLVLNPTVTGFDAALDVEAIADVTAFGVASSLWTVPALLNAWVNVGAPFQTVGYFKDAVGIVHLRGMIKNGGIGNVVFSLPTGFRPTSREDFVVITNTGLGTVAVEAGGDLYASSGGNGSFALSGISFRAI